MSSRSARSFAIVFLMCRLAFSSPARADEPAGELAALLKGVKFDLYAVAPGYSEGPTWKNGEVFFCSGALLRVDAGKQVYKFLEINPGGTVLRADGHLLICDNKSRAIVDLSPDGRLGVVAERFEAETRRSLNDLTVDARGNVYWTDPEGSSLDKPVGHIYRVRPDGRVDRLATGLAFPNGIEVDPVSQNLYVIESQSKKILRYPLPADNELLGKPAVFYDLGGSGGDGCTFDAQGNLWVTDFHRPETMTGRITVLSPEAKVLAYLPLPSKVVSNIAFGGTRHDEIFCTTGDPPGVFHAKVGVRGFAGHPGQPLPVSRYLNVVALRPHPEATILRQIAQIAVEAKLDVEPFAAARKQMQALAATLTDPQVRRDTAALLPAFDEAMVRHAHDQLLLAEVNRLGGKAVLEVTAPNWLRSIASDEALPVFARIVEIELDVYDKAASNQTLEQVARLSKLRKLMLPQGVFDDTGVSHLAKVATLEELTLNSPLVTNGSIDSLAGLKNLRKLGLEGTKVTEAGRQRLRELLPKAVVTP